MAPADWVHHAAPFFFWNIVWVDELPAMIRKPPSRRKIQNPWLTVSRGDVTENGPWRVHVSITRPARQISMSQMARWDPNVRENWLQRERTAIVLEPCPTKKCTHFQLSLERTEKCCLDKWTGKPPEPSFERP